MRLREQNDDRTVPNRPVTDTTPTDKRPTDRTDTMPRVETTPEPPRTAPPAPAGPRPRASLLATFSLIVGVAAALFVLSGALAGYGVVLGVVALILAIAGVSATSRRHVAGRTDALIGLVLGLGSVVLGILVVTGSLAWLSMDAQPVTNLREWLDAQFVNRF